MSMLSKIRDLLGLTQSEVDELAAELAGKAQADAAAKAEAERAAAAKVEAERVPVAGDDMPRTLLSLELEAKRIAARRSGHFDVPEGLDLEPTPDDFRRAARATGNPAALQAVEAELARLS